MPHTSVCARGYLKFTIKTNQSVKTNSANADPGLTNPCLFRWGVPLQKWSESPLNQVDTPT